MHVRPIGEIDLTTVGGVAARIEELRAAGFARVVLDLRAVTFMDSTGLRLALRLEEEANRDGRSFALIPGSAAVQRVFEVSGALDRLTFRGP